MNHVKECLGKEVEYIFNKWNHQDARQFPTRIVVGIDPVKGITLASPDSSDIRCCITPEYFGPCYAAAYFTAVCMIRKGFFDFKQINRYAYKINQIDEEYGSPVDILPTCPFA